MKSIYKKLFEAKKEIGKISKDSTNPFYKSKYFDINALLEHVEPILEKHNLLVLQPILDNKVVTKIVEVETGESVKSEMELTNITDPQKRGSEITYYRRYTLGSLLSLQAEDDDANTAIKKPTVNNNDLEWLNKYESDKKTITRNWNRALATIQEGRDIPYLRTKFKISKALEAELLNSK